MNILEAVDVSKVFGGLLALHQVSMCVTAGEIVALIGPNGAGKTTLFNILAGAFPPTSGRIIFDGEDITRFSSHKIARMGLARTFQIAAPFHSLSISENIRVSQLFGSKGHKTGFLDHRSQLLEYLGLAAKADKRASVLSLGELKLLELGRALSMSPKVLLLDEPLAGLNPKEMERIMVLIQETRDDGVTVLITEHIIRAVTGLADRVIVLNYGAKIAEGTPQEVFRSSVVRESYLGQGYDNGN